MFAKSHCGSQTACASVKPESSPIASSTITSITWETSRSMLGVLVLEEDLSAAIEFCEFCEFVEGMMGSPRSHR